MRKQNNTINQWYYIYLYMYCYCNQNVTTNEK